MPYITEERRMIQEQAREFTLNEVLPVANKLDPEKGDIPMSLRDKMAELGYFGILIPEMRGDLGLTPSQEGWLSASFFLAAFVFTIPISTVLSRFAPVPVMTTVFVGTSALFFLAAYLPSYPAQIGVRFLVSLLFIAASPARTLLVHDWFRPSEIGGANGAMNSMYGIIEPVAFFATAPLLTALGWQGVFWFLGVLSVVTTVGWILIARDAPSAHRTRGNADAAPRGAGPLSVIRRKDTLFLAMVSFGGDFAWASMITFWPTLAEESFGFSKNFIGVLLALSSLMTFPTALLSPLVVRFVGGQRPVLIGFTLLQVPVFALLAVSSNVAVLAVCMTMQGVCWIYGPVLNTSPFLMPRITAREVAVVVAVMTVSRTGAQTVGPALAGHNGEGDRYYTDGEAWILRLVETCRKSTVPMQVLPSPLATEIKDQIWGQIAETMRKTPP